MAGRICRPCGRGPDGCLDSAGPRVGLTAGSSGLVMPGSVSGRYSGQRPTCLLLHEAALTQNGLCCRKPTYGTPGYLSYDQVPMTLRSLESPSLGISSPCGLDNCFYDATRPGGSYRFCNLRKPLAAGESRRRDMSAACGNRVSGTAEARLKKIVVPGSEPSSARASYPRRRARTQLRLHVTDVTPAGG
jgi:hypothetical protein